MDLIKELDTSNSNLKIKRVRPGAIDQHPTTGSTIDLFSLLTDGPKSIQSIDGVNYVIVQPSFEESESHKIQEVDIIQRNMITAHLRKRITEIKKHIRVYNVDDILENSDFIESLLEEDKKGLNEGMKKLYLYLFEKQEQFKYSQIDHLIENFISKDFSFQMSLCLLTGTLVYKDELKNRHSLYKLTFKKGLDIMDNKGVEKTMRGLD